MKRSRGLNLTPTGIAFFAIFICLVLLVLGGQYLTRAAPSPGPLAQGTGSISGHVYQADGITPIANMHVYAEDYSTGYWWAGDNTGSDGSYTLTGLPSGNYRVSTCPSCDGHNYVQEFYSETDRHHLATPVEVTEPGTTSGIDFTLDPAGIVTGRVTEDDGTTPIEDLHIAAVRVSDRAWFGGPNTEASGYYTFTGVPATDVYIYACSSCNERPYIDEYYDDSLTESGATVLSISAGVTTTNVNFALAVGGVISGHVYAADGVTPLADAHVNANDFDTGHWGRGASTGPDGGYTIRGLPSGDYRVESNAAGCLQEFYRETAYWHWADRVTVNAPNATTGIDFTLDQGDATIRGHVRYGDGPPVSSIQVYGNRWNGPGWVYASTDASGAYTLPVTAGDWVVQIERWDWRADGHTMEATSLVAIGSGETINDVDITLLPNDATVTGVVQTQEGTPIPGAQVALLDETTRWYLNREVDTDATGTYTMSVPAGTWRINAWHEDYVCPPDQQITISTGQTLNKDLYLSALLARISGHVLDQNDDPVPGAGVWGWNPKQMAGGDGVPGVTTDATGAYTLSVYAGVWHLDTSHPPGYVSLPGRSVMVTDTQHLSGIDLRLNKATAVVQGTVRLGSYSGPPIDVQADTRVESRERGDWIHYHTIRDTGIYTSGVTAGQWDVYAHLEGYTCKESRWITVTDGATLSVDLVVLTNTAIISGTITDQYGFPVPNADMGIQDPVSGRDMIPWHLGWADSTGQYAVGVAVGRWRVCVWRDGYDSPQCPEITIANGETRVLNFVMQSRTSAIDGLVTDLNPNPADNVPLEGANVYLWDQHGIAPVSDSSGPLAGDTTDADGRFDFSLQISSGPYLVRAFKEGYAYSQGLIHALGGRHSAGTTRLPAQIGGTLSGQVTDGSDPVVNAVVVVRQAGSMSSAFTQDGTLARTTTDASGNYGFDVPFAPGDYTVVASAVGYDEALAAATVTSGANTVANLTLTSASAPAYGVVYLTTNVMTTTEENHEYPALVQVQNVGTETWISSGDDPVQFYNEWRDSGGNVHGSWTLTWLPYDVPPGDVVFFPVSSWTPGAGDYTLEWGLWQSGNWLGNTQSFSVTVTAPILPNLYVQETDISTDPPTVREGNTFDLLVFVHNDSDADASNVDVDISADGSPFGAGRYTLSSVPRRSTVLLRAAAYAPLSQGLHAISVRVDPDDHIAESDEGDNNAHKIIQVFPPSSDPIAPSGTITVNSGALTTNASSVSLNLFAEDNPGGTGVQQMWVTEFAFDAAAGQWQIAQESGWISYTTYLNWTLSSSGGIKHFQARFADGAWNISQAALAWINYTPDCDDIALAEWKLYQWRLTTGEAITATLTPCGGQGDPDLYAWIGASGGSPHYYSSNAGAAPDTIAVIAPETNEYNFWVYGFEATTYDFTMAHSASGLTAMGQDRGTQVLSEGKSLPEAPPSVVEVPTYVPATPVYKMILILIFKNWHAP